MSAGGGGGGTPLSILFKIDGIEQAKQLLATLDPEFKKLQAAVDETGKKAGTLGQGFKQVGDSGRSVEPLAGSLEKVNKSGTGLTQTTGKIKQGFDSTKSSASGVTAEVGKTSQSFDKNKSSTEGAIGSYQRYSSEGQKVKSSNEGVSASSGKVQTSSTEAAHSFDAMANSSGKVVQAGNQSRSSVDALSSAEGKLKSDTSSATGGLDAQSNTLVKLEGNTQKTVTATENLKSKFTTLVASGTTLVGSVTTLWQTYDSLGDAQLKVDKATNALHTTQLKIETLQTKLNKLTEEGKQGTDEYSLVSEKLEIAQAKLETTQGNLDNAQEDLNITQSEFYQRIIPETITVLGSLTTTIMSGKDALGVFAKGITGLGTSVGSLSKVLSLVSLTNPFFIAITAGAAIIGAFTTNLFGFRDAINSVGEALGNAIGPLKPVLTMVGQLGQGLVDAMGMGGEATKAYADTTEGSMNSVNTALEQSGQKTQGYVSLVSQEIKNADGFVVGFTNGYGQNMQKNVTATQEFGTALKTLSGVAKTEFEKTLSEAEKAYTQLQHLFDKTSTLNGIQASGLPGENTQFKLPPKSTLLKDVQGLQNAPTLSKSAQDVLSKTETQFDPSSKQVLFNQKELQKAYESGKISLQEYGGVLKALSKDHQLYGLVQDTDISQSDKLKQKHDAAAKAAQIEGVRWFEDSEILDIYNNNVAKRTGLLGQDTTATKEGTGAQEAWAVSALGTADAMDISSEATDKNAQAGVALNDSQKFMKDSNDDLIKSQNLYNGILNDSALMTDVVAQGQLRQQIEMQKAKVETLGTAAASAEYTKQLRTMEGQSVEVAKGIVAGNDALNSTKAAAFQAGGQYAFFSDNQNRASMNAASFSQGLREQQLALRLAEFAVSKTSGQVTQMRNEWRSGESQVISFSKGVEDQALAFEQAKLAVFEMGGTVSELRKEYDSGQASQLAYNQAYVQQQKTFEEDKVHADALKGTIQALNEQGASGKASVVAYNNAYNEQELAFTQSKLKADELHGTIQAMQDEFDVASVIAYNNAFADQKLKIEQDALAIEGMQGTIDALVESFKKGEMQHQAFTKGVRESELAFQNAKVAVLEQEGAIATLILHLNDGTQQTLAFEQGMYKTRESVLQAYAGVAELSGSMEEFATAVQSGLPQITAFQTAAINQRKAMDEMKVATAGTLGTIQELTTQLTDAGDKITRFNSGFATGYKGIMDWATGLDTAKGAASGAQSAFENVASVIGVDMSEAYGLSLEKSKEWVEVITGQPAAVQKAFDEIVSGGESMMKSLADVWGTGKKEVEKAFDGLGEKLGFKITDEMEDAIKPSIVAEKLKGRLTEGLNALSMADIGSEGFQQIADGMIDQVSQAIESSPGLAEVGMPLIEHLKQLKLNPGDVTLAATIKTEVDNIRAQQTLAVEGQANLNRGLSDPSGANSMIANLKNAETALANYQKAIEATQRSVQAYQQNTGGHMWDRAMNPTMDTGVNPWEALKGTAADASTPAKAPAAAGPTMDFTQQQQQIETLKQAIATITPAVTQMVTQSNAQIALLFQPLQQGAAGQTLLQFGQILQQLPPQVATMVTTSNASVATLFEPLRTGAVGQSIMQFGQIIMQIPAQVQSMVDTSNTSIALLFEPLRTGAVGQSILQFGQIILQIPTQVQGMVEQSNTALGLLFEPLRTGTVGATILQFGQIILQIPTQVAGMVEQSNAALLTMGEPLSTTVFPKMQTDSVTAFQAITTAATEESGKMGPLFDTAATAIANALKKSETTSTTTFQAITNIGKTESAKIGPLYDKAAQDIDKGLKKAEGTSKTTFEHVTKSADTESKKIGPLYEKASEAVIKALEKMEQKATKTFESIAKSADKARSSVDKLKSSIDALKDKTVTITTVHRTVMAATGFGPTIVDHPVNMTVGEAGPEFVSVVPLSSASGKNLPPLERLSAFGDPGKRRKGTLKEEMSVANSAPYANYTPKQPARRQMALGTINNYSNMNTNQNTISGSSSMVINGGAISSFSNSIDRFASSIQRQTNIINQGVAGDTIFGGNNITNISRMTRGIPNMILGGNGAPVAGMGTGTDGLIQGIKEAVMSAFGRTSINLTSNTVLDGEKINESQTKLFGLRNGASLK